MIFSFKFTPNVLVDSWLTTELESPAANLFLILKAGT